MKRIFIILIIILFCFQASGSGINSGGSISITPSTVLPDGVTATTQSQGDNSTKVATTAYVDRGLGGRLASSSGLASALPGTCTPPSTYYASDTETHYLCSGTTWYGYYKVSSDGAYGSGVKRNTSAMACPTGQDCIGSIGGNPYFNTDGTAGASALRLATITGTETLTNKTLTSPVINGATGTGGRFTGDLTGLMPSIVLTTASGVHDGADDAATLTDSGESFTTSQFVGMTLYNITDGSSCTVTANNATTITCTLTGGTDNNWDTNDVWQVGPGPAQSGSWIYVVAASTIRHPATAGYTVCYESDATAVLTVDMASSNMIFQGVLDTAVTALDAGDSIDSSGSTTGDFMCIHNKSATEAQGKGKRGKWVDGGAS